MVSCFVWFIFLFLSVFFIETFLTPCSTPPVSEDSCGGSEEPTLAETSQMDELDPAFKLDESNLHNKLYDCYSLEMSDLQILIGKAKENWRYALNKGKQCCCIKKAEN